MIIQENSIFAHLSPFSRDERNLNRYVRFIETLSSIPPRGNVKHHILPRSMFPEFVKSPDNIISLTEREHYIAHLLLWKAVGGKMTYAFRLMSHTVKGSREYSSLSRECSILTSERFIGSGNPHYGKFGEDHPKFGHAHSEYTKKRQSDGVKMFYADNPDARNAISDRKKEYWETEEHRAHARECKLGEKNPFFGTDITNSLSKEANMVREQRAKEGVRRWHRENPSWDRIEKDSPKWILWSLAPQIIESKKGSTALSRDLVGDRKYFNTILRIKQLAEEGWVPNEDERWVSVFGTTNKPSVEETTSLDSFT